MHAAHVALHSVVAQCHGMVMRSLDQPPPILIRLSEGEHLSHSTLADGANALPCNLRLSDSPTTEREDRRNLVGSDHVDPMRGEGIKDALAATASGCGTLRSPDRSSANHF